MRRPPLIHLSDDRRQGCCDRCALQGLVTPEIGPQAENVCDPCLEKERIADYLEYLALVGGVGGPALTGARRTG